MKLQPNGDRFVDRHCMQISSADHHPGDRVSTSRGAPGVYVTHHNRGVAPGGSSDLVGSVPFWNPSGVTSLSCS
ncbi:beta-glucosidase [Anopheles sinensis]|uniref:Beta-glucosidase n=1 Tax=Anopheles sinensis TaxID=74873 RepID=A0A084W7J8_ANOSI|nr:beta-glucosidase [Anopheles sinensis]